MWGWFAEEIVPMLYWIEVYALVGAAICLPIGALYLIASASRIGTAAFGAGVRMLKNFLAVLAER